MSLLALFLLSVCCILILLVVMTLLTNYYYGKQFHKCHDCKPNAVHLIPVDLPQRDMIDCLQNAIKTHGSRLNPELNFNNAKGKKLNSVELQKYCPELIQWFLTDELAQACSQVVGESVSYAGASEKYRVFARLYDDDADFLNWHYDNNFTKGNRYTLVIPLIVDDCNTAEFQYRERTSGQEVTVHIPLGQGVLYNGSDVYHRITQQTRGCKRMVLIIPLYANYEKSLFGAFREKMRNYTYQQLTL